MADPAELRQAADDAVSELTAVVVDARTRATRHGTYVPPPGAPAPRRRRQPGSLRHLAEVVRDNRWCPGVAVDKDAVAALLAGEPRLVSDATFVVAVVRACRHIEGVPLDDDEAARLALAAQHAAHLIEEARAVPGAVPDDVPGYVPGDVPDAGAVPVAPGPARTVLGPPGSRRRLLRWAGGIGAALALAGSAAVVLTVGPAEPTGGADAVAPAEEGCGNEGREDDILADPGVVAADDDATRITPTLDFDSMNGSARYARHDGRTFYWGRAGSDDQDPRAGGVRIRWRTADGPWHDCAVALPVTERDYVRSPAVATTIDERAVTVQVCLWRDDPRRENCTVPLG